MTVLIAATALTTMIASPANARVHSRASDNAKAAHAQALYPNGNSPQYGPLRVDGSLPRGHGTDPSGYVRIEESKDCRGCH
jgi:hypothetical protein